MKHVQSYLYQLIGRDSPETAEIYATGDMAMACHGLMRGVAQIDIGIRDSQLAHELWCWLKPYPIPLIMPNTGVMINLGPQPSPADMPTAIQFAGKQTKNDCYS